MMTFRLAPLCLPLVSLLRDPVPWWLPGLFLSVSLCLPSTGSSSMMTSRFVSLCLPLSPFYGIQFHDDFWVVSLCFLLFPLSLNLEACFSLSSYVDLLTFICPGPWWFGGLSPCATEIWFLMIWRLCHESELWKSKAGVLVYKDRGGLKIDLATGQNWFIKAIERELIWGGGGPPPPPPPLWNWYGGTCWEWFWSATKGRSVTIGCCWKIAMS